MSLNTASPYSRDGKGSVPMVGTTPPTPRGNQGDDGELSPEGIDWLSMAHDAYDTSEDWFDSAVRNDLERNIAHFQNKHAPGSKYYTKQYQHRARGFRPKSRSVVRKNEAMAAQAFFATREIVDVRAEDTSNIVQRVSAEINKELLQYRFNNTIPWFLTVLGAMQDALVNGVCISHNYWKYEEQIQQVPMYDARGEAIFDEAGEHATEEQVEVIHDTPAIDLRPVENVRFSPTANWLDPLNTSPFLIDRMTMTIDDLLSLMRQDATKSKIPWRQGIGVGTLMQGKSDEYSDDSIHRQRQRSQLDPVEETDYLESRFDAIWVHRNIMRYEGRDYIYYTLGVHLLLSDPIPLEMEYPHLKPGQRPYTLGFVTIETHKNYPESLVGMASGLQQEANELNNQRRDNVALSLNRRYFVKRGQGIDLTSLQRNVPGGVTLMNNIDGDIRSEAPPDVTSSSYQEQDRINIDFDEVAGNFSTASVGSNRQMNETVGGMEMLSGDADAMTEYQLRVFSETYIENTIKQIIQLEQRHESDPAILALVGNKIGMMEKYGVSEILDDMIQGNMTVEVNVGFGATNPSQRIGRLTQVIGTINQLAPQLAQRVDQEEVGKELLGAAGFKDTGRFFVPETPEAEQPQEQPDTQIVLEQIRGQNAKELAQMKFQMDEYLENLRTQNDVRKEQLEVEREDRVRMQEFAEFDSELNVRMQEMELKKQTMEAQTKAKLAERAISERNANARFNAEIAVKREKGTGI